MENPISNFVKDLTKREYILLVLFIILAIGYLLMMWGSQQDIAQYSKLYIECMNSQSFGGFNYSLPPPTA